MLFYTKSQPLQCVSILLVLPAAVLSGNVTSTHAQPALPQCQAASTVQATEMCVKPKYCQSDHAPSRHSQSHLPRREEQPIAGYEYSFPAMGTVVSFRTYSDSEQHVESAFEKAELRVQKLAAKLTDYDATSETRRLTERASSHNATVSDDLWQILLKSDDWYHRTGGAFDASLGNLTLLWRKYRRVHRLPTGQQIGDALAHTGWNLVTLDKSNQTVRFDSAELRLDFGAIGKGFVVDAAFNSLLKSGLPLSLVNVSGNIRCGQPPPGREGWNIEISPLSEGGKPLRRIQIANCSIATSGDLWQSIDVDGKRLSHILDPRTGIGVPGPLAATCIAAQAVDADALATAACVLGPNGLDRLQTAAPKSAILLARAKEPGQAQPLAESSPDIELYEIGRFPKDIQLTGVRIDEGRISNDK